MVQDHGSLWCVTQNFPEILLKTNRLFLYIRTCIIACVCMRVSGVFFGGGWGMNGWGRWGGVCLYASQSIMHNTNLCIWSSSCWNAQWSGYLHSFFPLRCLWFLLQCVLLPISVPLWCVNQNQKEHWWGTSHWWLKSQGIYCHPTVSISLSLTLLLVIFFTSSHF